MSDSAGFGVPGGRGRCGYVSPLGASAMAAVAALLVAACSPAAPGGQPGSLTAASASTSTATTASPAPGAVPVLAVPPPGPVSGVELRSPESAAVAWLSRWCGYDYRSPMGTGENLAHPAMTERGWLAFDPLTAPPRAQAWAAIVAERATAGCTAPVAIVSPEAPRSSTGAYVIVTAQRLVTPRGGAPRVEQVRETRQVLFREGHWLVDIAANGAG